MNILITCIGALCENTPSVSYNKGTVEAKMTGEACCKYLLKKRKHSPDMVIALCMSDACKENKAKNYLSAYKYFENSIRDFCAGEGIRVPAFEAVRITKSEENANYFGKSIFMVRQLIRKNSLPSNTRIMIDTALKLHSINIMLQMMTCILKNDGYNIIESYYAFPDRERIIEDNTNHLMDMAEAVSEFSEYGTADKMRACFEAYSNKKPEPVVSRLMEAMQSFSDSIQLCQTERLQDILNNEIFPALEEIENMSGPAAMREDVFTLKLMAVTLFVENIPKYLVSSGVLKYDNIQNNTLNSPEVNLLYTQMILSCCQKGNEGSSAAIAENTKKRLLRLELMKRYIDNGNVSPADADEIRLFIDTIAHFKQMIGENRPQAALRGYIPVNEAEEKIIDIINKFNPSSCGKFINTLKVHPGILTAFINIMMNDDRKAAEEQKKKSDAAAGEMNEIDKKLDGIKGFSMKSVRRNLPGIRLNINRDRIDDFRKFLAYYVYIKKFVRNYLNHAVEFNDELTPGQITEFQGYSVWTGALTIKNITENLTEAMKCLDACIIKDFDAFRPVKKYYMTVPKNPLPDSYEDILPEQCGNPMNSPLLDYDRTNFPLIPVIANSVKAGEVIKIYGIKPDSENADIWEEKLLSELNGLVIEKDFDYEYEQLDISGYSGSNISLELFNTLVSTFENGDSIYADMTSVEDPIPIIMMMFMNYLMMYRKDTKIEAAVYGKYDMFYDITKTVYANNAIRTADSSSDARNKLENILSDEKQDNGPETSNVCVEEEKTENTEEISDNVNDENVYSEKVDIAAA